jgi:5-methylcytosine-specific restriction endonuclease McrA
LTRRRGFTLGVKVAARKRATDPQGNLRCDRCGRIVKKDFRVDHIVGVGMGGRHDLDNAQILCKLCYDPKDAADNARAKYLSKVEATHLGIARIQSRGFAKPPAKPSTTRPSSKTLPRRPLYER